MARARARRRARRARLVCGTTRRPDGGLRPVPSRAHARDGAPLARGAVLPSHVPREHGPAVAVALYDHALRPQHVDRRGGTAHGRRRGCAARRHERSAGARGDRLVANDPSGALLAWRGWTLGDRLTTVGETLPLPPIESFRPGGAFASQRDDGTRPMDELDSRAGYAARARASFGHALRVQGAFTDNRGNRRLERGQYSWETRFGQAGLELRLGPQVTLLAEGAQGDTGMGPALPGGPQVQLRFRVGYALVSWSRSAWRLSARVERVRERGSRRDGGARRGIRMGGHDRGVLEAQPVRPSRNRVRGRAERSSRSGSRCGRRSAGHARTSPRLLESRGAS